jgi:hypothetical protein
VSFQSLTCKMYGYTRVQVFKFQIQFSNSELFQMEGRERTIQQLQRSGLFATSTVADKCNFFSI